MIVDELMKFFSGDGGFSGEDAHDPALRGFCRRLHPGLHADNGQKVGVAKGADGMNRGRVAGDHNESGAPFDEVIGDFEDTFVDHLRRLVPVRAPGRVAHVVDWHSGE